MKTIYHEKFFTLKKFYGNKILWFALNRSDKNLMGFNFTETQFHAQCHGNSIVDSIHRKTIKLNCM